MPASLTSARCGAHTRAGHPCRQPATRGQARCYVHGGSSPQAKAAAVRRLAEQRASRLLADLGHVEPVTDPIGALEHVAGQAVALADLLRGVVSQLEELRYRGSGGADTENIRGELQAYLSALGRAESVLAKLAALGLDERRVRVQENVAAVLTAAIAAVLSNPKLGLDDDRQRIGRGLIALELQARDVAIVGRPGLPASVAVAGAPAQTYEGGVS